MTAMMIRKKNVRKPCSPRPEVHKCRLCPLRGAQQDTPEQRGSQGWRARTVSV